MFFIRTLKITHIMKQILRTLIIATSSLSLLACNLESTKKELTTHNDTTTSNIITTDDNQSSSKVEQNISNETKSNPSKDSYITKNIEINKFNELEVNCAAEIIYNSGESPSISITTDNNTLNNLISTVNDNTLSISLKGNNSYDYLKIEINGPSILEDIDLSGACSLKNVGRINPRSLDVECLGASNIILNDVSCTEINIDCLGASSTNITGLQCDELDIECSGASNVIISGRCINAEYSADGASTIDVTKLNASKIIKEMITGASTIKK